MIAEQAMLEPWNAFLAVQPACEQAKAEELRTFADHIPEPEAARNTPTAEAGRILQRSSFLCPCLCFGNILLTTLSILEGLHIF